MSTVKRVWSNKIWDFSKMKWLLILTELGQRNIRSITELELLGLLAYQIKTWLTEEENLRLKESATSIRILEYCECWLIYS